jgi:hypothetical protein
VRLCCIRENKVSPKRKGVKQAVREFFLPGLLPARFDKSSVETLPHFFFFLTLLSREVPENKSMFRSEFYSFTIGDRTFAGPRAAAGPS